MKTILACITVITFLFVQAQSAESSIGGVDKAEAQESQDFEEPIFRVMKSPDGEVYFPQGKESYYTKYYRAAKLPSMQHNREERGKVKFRLGILRSFTKPLFLTYSRGADGPLVQIARLQLRDVNNSLEPGDVELSGDVVVGERIARNLEAAAVDPDIRAPLGDLTKEQRQMYQGLDGTVWILEVSTEKDYTMEDIWSPEYIGNMDLKFLEEHNLPKVNTKWFVEFCESLLKITDMKLSDYPISTLLENG